MEFDVDSLNNPHYNLRSGIFYIDELIRRFDGDVVLALAGYNAGPHNAKKWKNENEGKDADLFIEDIGFTETRGYVKKVMANYWTYTLLRKYGQYSYGNPLFSQKGPS